MNLYIWKSVAFGNMFTYGEVIVMAGTLTYARMKARGEFYNHPAVDKMFAKAEKDVFWQYRLEHLYKEFIRDLSTFPVIKESGCIIHGYV